MTEENHDSTQLQETVNDLVAALQILITNQKRGTLTSRDWLVAQHAVNRAEGKE